MLLFPNGDTPLFALTSLMKKRVVDDPEFNWWEKEMSTQRIPLNANMSLAGTTITTATNTGEVASSLKDGHLLFVEGSDTGEILLVNGDPSSDTSVNVIRAYAGTTATQVIFASEGINPNLLVIGSAYEEASEAPTGVNYDVSKVFNYTQIFRRTLELTNTAIKTRLRTGDAVREAKREALQYHSAEIERMLWLGERFEGSRNGKPIRTMRGVMNWITATNVVEQAGAPLNLANFEEHLRRAFQFGSNEKMAFVGDLALLTINQIARLNSNYQIFANEKEFGMDVQKLITPFGTVMMKRHPLFNHNPGGTTLTTNYQGMNSWFVMLDMKELMWVHLKDRDTKFESKLQDNGLDGLKSGYITEGSMEMHHSKAHFAIKGLTTASTDA